MLKCNISQLIVQCKRGYSRYTAVFVHYLGNSIFQRVRRKKFPLKVGGAVAPSAPHLDPPLRQ